MEFIDTKTSLANRFSIGIVKPAGIFYISIPVSNRMVDYEEYFRIDEYTYRITESDMNYGIELARKCRLGEMDKWLILKPGADRGTPT